MEAIRRCIARERDCERHLGIPIMPACIVFCIISSLLDTYALWFLPSAAAYILMILSTFLMVSGVTTAIYNIPLFTKFYLLFESLLLIPLCVVFGFVTLTVADYDQVHANWWNDSHKYERWLYQIKKGLLCSVLVVSVLGVIFSIISIVAFRKLKKLYDRPSHQLDCPSPVPPSSGMVTQSTYSISPAVIMIPTLDTIVRKMDETVQQTSTIPDRPSTLPQL